MSDNETETKFIESGSPIGILERAEFRSLKNEHLELHRAERGDR